MYSFGVKFLNKKEKIGVHGDRLPHWEQDSVAVFVTWRLEDSLPACLLHRFRFERAHWLEQHAKPWDKTTEEEYYKRFGQRIDDWLDQGIGRCVLRDPVDRGILEERLTRFDGFRYSLKAFVIMPNHVHVLFCPHSRHSPDETVGAWKAHSARLINRRRNCSGPLWQQKYWDRLIRSPAHGQRVLQYIRRNPVKANLPVHNFTLWVSDELSGA